MKILKIFGYVVGVHLIAFLCIFASPGCQSGPSNVPTPDATMPVASGPAPVSFNAPAPQPVDLSTPSSAYSSPSDHASPTRPGSPAAVAVSPARPAQDVAPVSSYTVGKGDSLWSIAQKNGLSVSELAKANRISTGTVLKPGAKLIIPGKPGHVAAKEAAPAPAVAPAAAAARASGESLKHTVQPGESLGVIARKYQVKTGDLAAANNITDPSKVKAGQQLIIPGFTPVAAKSKSATPRTASTSAATPAAAEPAPAETPAAPPASMTPHFDIKAPPVGQDLDAGLKDTSTEVPTIKVEEPKS